jgi:hypothetical protein
MSSLPISPSPKKDNAWTSITHQFPGLDMSGGAGKAIFRKKQASPEDGFRNNYYSGPMCNRSQVT